MAGPKRQKQIKLALRQLLPQAPLADFLEIESKANAGHLRHLPPSIAARQATTAYIRHAHTEYDQYLADGFDPDAARYFVLDTMNEVLETWQSNLRISAKEETEQ